MQTKAVIITLASSAGMGTALGFNTPAAIVYTNANTTTLPEPLNENEMSWLGNQYKFSILLKLFCIISICIIYLSSEHNAYFHNVFHDILWNSGRNNW